VCRVRVAWFLMCILRPSHHCYPHPQQVQQLTFSLIVHISYCDSRQQLIQHPITWKDLRSHNIESIRNIRLSRPSSRRSFEYTDIYALPPLLLSGQVRLVEFLNRSICLPPLCANDPVRRSRAPALGLFVVKCTSRVASSSVRCRRSRPRQLSVPF